MMNPNTFRNHYTIKTQTPTSKMSSPTSPTTPTIPRPVAIPAPQSLPPPYSPHGSENGDDEADEDFTTPGTTIHINASTTIRGNNNIVQCPTLDAAHLAAQITAALRQHNYQLGTDVGPLTIRIDRSIHVVGDRNAVGTMGAGVGARGPVTPRQREEIAKRLALAKQRAGEAGTGAAQGTKRKGDEEEGREAKRAALSRAESCPPS